MGVGERDPNHSFSLAGIRMACETTTLFCLKCLTLYQGTVHSVSLVLCAMLVGFSCDNYYWFNILYFIPALGSVFESN